MHSFACLISCAKNNILFLYWMYFHLNLTGINLNLIICVYFFKHLKQRIVCVKNKNILCLFKLQWIFWRKILLNRNAEKWSYKFYWQKYNILYTKELKESLKLERHFILLKGISWYKSYVNLLDVNLLDVNLLDVNH